MKHRTALIVVILVLAAALLIGACLFFFVFRKDLTASVLVYWADRFEQSGRYNRTITLYRQAEKLTPEDEDIPRLLAKAYQLSGNFTKAEYTLVSAITREPESVELYAELSRVYLAQDKLLDAEQMLGSIANASVKSQVEALRPATPVISPESGYYSEYIEITASAASGKVYITTNGEFPSLESNLYTGPIQLEGGETTVIAISVDDNGLVSSAAYAGYTVGNVVEEVSLEDSALESYVREQLGKAAGDSLMSDELWSIEELELVDALSAEAGKVTDIALRINPDIDPKTNHCIDTGQADSKFGISYEEVLEHAKEIRALKYINIIGLHLHIGSQIRELHVFENMCNKVNVIVENLEKLGCSFRFVDVGGGLGVNYDVPENEPIPNFASLFSIVHNHLSVGDREVHFEFGRSIVAECGELITKVLFNKTTATGRKLVIVDASMTELIRPALYGSYHNIENITSEDEARDKYTIVGTACESTDVFDENVTLRKTRRGDLLTIKSAGAYGMSMASRYNLHDLPGAVYSDEIQ